MPKYTATSTHKRYHRVVHAVKHRVGAKPGGEFWRSHLFHFETDCYQSGYPSPRGLCLESTA